MSVGFFSIFVNILMLTGPLFMLQVYDRVLTSRSEATLVTLIGIVTFLFLMMGVLDHARGRVLARAGARLQAKLDSRVLRAILTRAIAPAERARPATGVRDLEAIQRFFSGSGPFAFFDAPWTPVFLCVLFMFHWLLGALAVFSGVLLLLIALLNQARTALPAPRAILEAQGLTVAAPGAKVPAVRGASFRLEPGQAAGIAGPSASGKSTLARALAGVWRPVGGSVRLDGAELEQYGQTLGQHIGYLPQEVVLFEGTVAENISRLSPTARDEDVIDAAKRTGAHKMILRLPGGYDFQVSAGGAALSGGQRQRIALARAFYGAPVLVVMDEPDSNLDAEGTMALSRAVEGHKKRGGAAVIVAHRHGAFAQCDQVYVMEAGRPVPATRRRKAPVRRLQAGPRKGRDALPPPATKRSRRYLSRRSSRSARRRAAATNRSPPRSRGSGASGPPPQRPRRRMRSRTQGTRARRAAPRSRG